MASYPEVSYRMINYIRRAGAIPRAVMAWLVRADATENAGIYPILVRSTNFCRPSSSPAMIEFVRLAAGANGIRTCMGLFLSSSCFWFMASFLLGAGKPFFVPSPGSGFAERAEGVKGSKR